MIDIKKDMKQYSDNEFNEAFEEYCAEINEMMKQEPIQKLTLEDVWEGAR